MRALADVDADIARTRAEMDSARGTECEVYARIVGYYRSVHNWNAGKRAEYSKRAMFRIDRGA